jgi:hypothetical protein
LNRDIERIKKQLSLIVENQTFDEAGLVAMFTYIRNVLESDSVKHNYQTLNFYCNLLSHSSIKKSHFGYNCLKDLMERITKNWSNTDMSASIIEEGSIFNIRLLAIEMKIFFDQYELPAFLAALDNRKNLTHMLAVQLLGKSISFPENIIEKSNLNINKLHRKERKIVKLYIDIKKLGESLHPLNPPILTKIEFITDDSRDTIQMRLKLGEKAYMTMDFIPKMF